jgi:hypothetical protein
MFSFSSVVLVQIGYWLQVSAQMHDTQLKLVNSNHTISLPRGWLAMFLPLANNPDALAMSSTSAKQFLLEPAPEPLTMTVFSSSCIIFVVKFVKIWLS